MTANGARAALEMLCAFAPLLVLSLRVELERVEDAAEDALDETMTSSSSELVGRSGTRRDGACRFAVVSVMNELQVTKDARTDNDPPV